MGCHVLSYFAAFACLGPVPPLRPLALLLLAACRITAGWQYPSSLGGYGGSYPCRTSSPRRPPCQAGGEGQCEGSKNIFCLILNRNGGGSLGLEVLCLGDLRLGLLHSAPRIGSISFAMPVVADVICIH